MPTLDSGHLPWRTCVTCGFRFKRPKRPGRPSMYCDLCRERVLAKVMGPVTSDLALLDEVAATIAVEQGHVDFDALYRATAADRPEGVCGECHRPLVRDHGEDGAGEPVELCQWCELGDDTALPAAAIICARVAGVSLRTAAAWEQEGPPE